MKYIKCPHCGDDEMGYRTNTLSIGEGSFCLIVNHDGTSYEDDVEITRYGDSYYYNVGEEKLYCNNCDKYVCTYGEMLEGERNNEQ